MEVGLVFVFQNFMDGVSDAEAYKRDLYIAGLAEPLGFDILACAEHHFFNYGMAPDNMQILAFMAGRTSKIKLLTAAVILPWHNPLRVAENMVVLDHISEGRALFGIGRGLARREYDAFGLDMNESRDRFDEAAAMIVAGLETGVVEGDGPHYKQKRTELRPGPYASFRDRFYAVAMSAESVPSVARLAARMMVFAQKPWEQMVPHFESYRQLYQQYHQRPAPRPVTCDFVICDESAERAELLAREHIANYYTSVVQHYEMAGDHFAKTKGYGGYADNASLLRSIGHEAAANGFVDINVWGTPQQILEKMDRRRQALGDFDELVQGSYGGVSREDSEKSLRLFAAKVLPELKSW